MTKLLKFGCSVALCLAAVATPASGWAKQSTSVNRPENKELYASVGDVLAKFALRESLPNAFGGADIFGRKRDRGFVEIRFMGLGENGFAIFRRRSTDVYSNETTMSRSGVQYGTATVTGDSHSAHVSTMTTGPQSATVQALPPDTFEFALDLSKSNVITVEDRIIHIIQADQGGVKFVLRKQ